VGRLEVARAVGLAAALAQQADDAARRVPPRDGQQHHRADVHVVVARDGQVGVGLGVLDEHGCRVLGDLGAQALAEVDGEAAGCGGGRRVAPLVQRRQLGAVGLLRGPALHDEDVVGGGQLPRAARHRRERRLQVSGEQLTGEPLGLLEPALAPVQAAMCGPHVQQVAGAVGECGRLQRLDQEVVGTELEGPSGGFEGVVGGEHDHRQLGRRRALAQARQDRVAVEVRHVQVQEHEIGIVLLDPVEHEPGIGDRVDLSQACT
jgi:hypothetical protein